MPNPPTNSQPLDSSAAWTLEVVRGFRTGQRYPLLGDAVTLGNAAPTGNSTAFLHLADQEGASPRKMAGQHAALSWSAGLWVVRDLETPGGTFVNQRRVLSGSAVPLAEGDLLQLGSVQLRLVRGVVAMAPPTPQPVPAAPVGAEFSYRSSSSGTICRTWDDFVTFSAQRWDDLRDDVTSGRIAAFVASMGRPDLAPPRLKSSPMSEQADEALDAWLGRLPTRSPAVPELDVHPRRVAISVPTGGVAVTRKVRVANVGYRLLRARVRLEGATGATFTLGPEFAREVVIRDSAEISFDVAVPDPFTVSASAQLVISAAGAEQRVAIQVDRRDATVRLDPVGAGFDPVPDPLALPGPVAAFLALSVAKRVTIAALMALATRLLVGIAGGAIGEDAMSASGPEVPHLGGVVLVFAATGAGLGGWGMARRSGPVDAGSGAVAGAGLGTLLAASSVALCRVIEPALGALAASPIVVCGLWAVLGGGLAMLVPGGKSLTTEPTQ